MKKKTQNGRFREIFPGALPSHSVTLDALWSQTLRRGPSLGAVSAAEAVPGERVGPSWDTALGVHGAGCLQEWSFLHMDPLPLTSWSWKNGAFHHWLSETGTPFLTFWLRDPKVIASQLKQIEKWVWANLHSSHQSNKSESFPAHPTLFPSKFSFTLQRYVIWSPGSNDL